MNTTATAPRKINLQRGLPGWYVYYANGVRDTFDINKVATGMWTVKYTNRRNTTTETWVVENLNAARALIAATI